MTRKLHAAVSAAALSAVLLAGAPAFSQAETGVGQGAAGQLRDSAAAAMVQLGIDTEGIETLSVEQLTEIEGVANSTDDVDVKRAQIAEIIGAAEPTAGVGSEAAGQLSDSVPAELVQLGIDTEPVEALTLDQLAQIENVVNSSDEVDTKRHRIEQILME